MVKIILLDRDGVINKNNKDQYVRSWEHFEFLPGSIEAIKKITDLGIEIFVISNQAGVAKGLYTEEELSRMTQNMLGAIKAGGGNVNKVHYCLHRDEDACDCRKPKTGLFEQAIVGRKVDPGQVFVIGDSARDIQAGQKLGFRTILVLSGNTKDREEINDFELKPDFIAKDLLDAVDTVIVKENN
ncbi:MAG: HAD-IIIA family hydrolase [Candidatus Omnitrophota bacterium]